MPSLAWRRSARKKGALLSGASPSPVVDVTHSSAAYGSSADTCVDRIRCVLACRSIVHLVVML